MSADLHKQIEDMKLNSRVLAAQVNSHKNVIDALMVENLNCRCNFALSQDYLHEAHADMNKLKAQIEALHAQIVKLKEVPEEKPVVSELEQHAADLELLENADPVAQTDTDNA